MKISNFEFWWAANIVWADFLIFLVLRNLIFSHLGVTVTLNQLFTICWQVKSKYMLRQPFLHIFTEGKKIIKGVLSPEYKLCWQLHSSCLDISCAKLHEGSNAKLPCTWRKINFIRDISSCVMIQCMIVAFDVYLAGSKFTAITFNSQQWVQQK